MNARSLYIKRNQLLSLCLIAMVSFRCSNAEHQTRLTNDVDSASYYMGLYTGIVLRGVDYNEFNKTIFDVGVRRTLSVHDTILSMEYQKADSVIDNFILKSNKKQQQRFREEGVNFLKTNKIRKGVITTPSGLQYEIIHEGAGESPMRQDSVTLQYKGTFINGKEFINSYKGGQMTRFLMNTITVPGWVEILPQMKLGAHYKIYLPPALAYGDNPIPTPEGLLKSNMTIIFELELISIKHIN